MLNGCGESEEFPKCSQKVRKKRPRSTRWLNGRSKKECSTAALIRMCSLIRLGTVHQVQVVSDSKYVVDAINKGWLRNWVQKGFKDKKNPDLWRKLLPLLDRYRPTFTWVKGHNNHPQNERCDALAVAASKGPNLPPDSGYSD